MEGKIIEYFEGKMSLTESIEFLRSVEADKELKQLFINTQNCQALLRILPEKKDKHAGKLAYERFMQTTRRRTVRRIVLRSFAYAAAITLLIGATWYFAAKQPDMQASITQVYAPPGQRTKITFEDGTIVWLNAHTTLSYSADDFAQNRQVELNGEAFFEVATNHEKPFTVIAQGVNITALGTKFNVISYPENNETQVALIEGSVRVWDNAGHELLLKPNQQANYRGNTLAMQQNPSSLSPSSSVSSENTSASDWSGSSLTVQKIENEDYFLWINGLYSFVNEPLTEVLQKLERYYDVIIEVTDPSILDDEFTGKFRQQDGVDMILRVIQHMRPFKIEKKEDKIVLTN